MSAGTAVRRRIAKHLPGAVGGCHDRLAMSALGKGQEMVNLLSQDQSLAEVSPVALDGALSLRYLQLGAPDQE